MAIINYDVGLPARQGNGSTPPAPGGIYGEGLFTKALPDLYTLTKNGLVYSLAVAGINPTAFTGGAAGTPVFGIYNPSNSGRDVVILQARAAVRTPGTAAVSSALNFFMGVQGGTAPTGTRTQPTNMLSGVASGASSYCMVNTANTGAVASSLVAASAGITAVVTTATQQVSQLLDNVNGAIIVTQGNYLAYGLAAGLTGGSIDFSLLFAEVPV